MAEKVPNTTFTQKQCPKCGQVEPVTHGEVNDVHGFKLRCPHCDQFVGWGGKMKAIKDDNGSRNLSSQWTAKRLNADHCEMCLRSKQLIGKGERLEVHHVKPIEDGGEDLPQNIWVVCTSCHRLIHHQRKYLHEHLKTFAKAYEALQRFKENNPELYRRIHWHYPDDSDEFKENFG